MRLVIQRVKRASVSVEGKIVSSISQGLCVFVGISSKDSPAHAEYIQRKLLKMRLWPDENGRDWTKSVVDLERPVLFVSQFTLHASVAKGYKPSFSRAMPPAMAKEFYHTFVELCREKYGNPDKIKEGVFGAMMDVELVNDGPVTITLDSAEFVKESPSQVTT